MSTRSHNAIAKRFNEDDQIDRLVREAVRKAIRRHFSAGQQVVVWRDGKAVWVDEKELGAAK
jgi:hypothetical protein